MDMGALTMAVSQSQVASMASLSVLKLQMNTSDTMSSNMIDMMETMAVDPNKGANIDALV